MEASLKLGGFIWAPELRKKVGEILEFFLVIFFGGRDFQILKSRPDFEKKAKFEVARFWCSRTEWRLVWTLFWCFGP
jgi:hypothetical protein